MIKRFIMICLGLLLVLGGCASNQAYNNQAYNNEEIYKIVDEALTRGELANLLYLGEFATPNENALETEAGLAYGCVEPGSRLPLGAEGDIWGLLQGFATAEDIKAYIRNTFAPELAEEYLAQMFTAAGDKYVIQDGQLLQCRTLPAWPLSLIQWQHEPASVLENQPNKLVVLLKGEFMLTGIEAELPLTLSRQGGQWLLDESFSPQEQQPEEGYYSQAELQNIIEETLKRADQANLLYAADNFTIIEGSGRRIFANVPSYDPEYTYDIYYGVVDSGYQRQEEYAALAREFTTTEAIRQLYRDSFVPERAEFYLQNLLDQEHPRYIDQPEGLAYDLGIACMPITLLEWQPDDYTVWLNSERELLVIMRADYPHWQANYYPLRLQLVDGQWLCDETYEASVFEHRWQLENSIQNNN